MSSNWSVYDALEASGTFTEKAMLFMPVYDKCLFMVVVKHLILSVLVVLPVWVVNLSVSLSVKSKKKTWTNSAKTWRILCFAIDICIALVKEN